MQCRFTIAALLLFMFLIPGSICVCIAKNAPVIDGEPLVIHFDQGKTSISAADKARIKQLLDDFDLTGGAKILVVGHTDNRGDAQGNIKLSYQRAQQVRRQLIRIIGGKVEKDIVVIGRGAENPVADNGSHAGRARNRRVEIYLAQLVSGQLIGKKRRIDPDQVAVEKLVQDARGLLRRHQLPEALRVLNEAYALGGDLVSSWQGVFGIAGYYTGMTPAKVKAHLSMAIQLDPFNEEARDYMGRVDARDKVASGTITSEMGRSAGDAIVVLSDSQIYEYLALFGVRVIAHNLLAQGGIEAWRCRDSNGNVATYHFDRSRIYDGLYDP